MTSIITVPPELVDLWVDLLEVRSDQAVFALAAQWGYTQAAEELEEFLKETIDTPCNNSMTNLSPATLAVLDAIESRIDRCAALAAALRAVADQVVPEYRENRPKTFDEKHRKMDASVIRYCLLDIADELEAQ